MKAFVLTDFERPASLEEVPCPVPTDDEVLIRIEATTVNPVDRMVADGFFRGAQEYRHPAVFGRDLCGTVVAAGRSVTRFAVDQSVWGFIKREHIGNGTFAQYVTSPVDRFIAAKPVTLSVVGAGVLGMSSVTALECLDALHPKAGQLVLINGASGGVGSYAIQIAAAWGLTVIATARPGAATDYVRQLGADHVVDWTTGSLAEQVREIAPEGVDGLVDLVKWDSSPVIGTDNSAGRQKFAALAKAVLGPGGRVASVTNAADPRFLGDVVGKNVHSTPTLLSLGRISALVDTGQLRSPVDSTIPFARIGEAFERPLSGGLGRIAVTMDQE